MYCTLICTSYTVLQLCTYIRTYIHTYIIYIYVNIYMSYITIVCMYLHCVLIWSDLYVDRRIFNWERQWPYPDVAGFWLKRLLRVLPADSENDGHVTDPTSPWCPVLGFVCFQLMESWMRFRGHGWVQLKWQGCDFSPCKGLVGWNVYVCCRLIEVCARWDDKYRIWDVKIERVLIYMRCERGKIMLAPCHGNTLRYCALPLPPGSWDTMGSLTEQQKWRKDEQPTWNCFFFHGLIKPTEWIWKGKHGCKPLAVYINLGYPITKTSS